MRILITGGSGLIGKQLTEVLLRNGHQVGWLTRRKYAKVNVHSFIWNIETGYLEANAMIWADAIVHLAGAGIAEKRWTEKRKQEIISSRIKSTNLLYEALKKKPHHVQKIVCASAIGFYGNTDKIVEETAQPQNGFLSKSCSVWETASMQLKEVVPQHVILRIGIVLSNLGGAYPELTKTKSFGILPILGSGKQIYSWIHVQDVCAIILFAIANQKVNGIYNAVAPNPIAQKKLMQKISKTLPTVAICIPIPQFVLHLILGEMSNTVLYSQKISAKKIIDCGFQFELPDIDDALHEIIKKV